MHGPPLHYIGILKKIPQVGGGQKPGLLLLLFIVVFVAFDPLEYMLQKVPISQKFGNRSVGDIDFNPVALGGKDIREELSAAPDIVPYDPCRTAAPVIEGDISPPGDGVLFAVVPGSIRSRDPPAEPVSEKPVP